MWWVVKYSQKAHPMKEVDLDQRDLLRWAKPMANLQIVHLLGLAITMSGRRKDYYLVPRQMLTVVLQKATSFIFNQ